MARLQQAFPTLVLLKLMINNTVVLCLTSNILLLLPRNYGAVNMFKVDILFPGHHLHADNDGE